MTFDDTVLDGFFDELESIEKQAGIGQLFKPLASGLAKTFKGFARGAQNLGRAATGTVTSKAGKQIALAGPKRMALARAGAKQMLPGAAVAGTGALAGYGAYKMGS